MTGHTPGPWVWDKASNGYTRTILRGRGDSPVLEPMGGAYADDDCVAVTIVDADLIAAAPDLYEVAQAILRVVDDASLPGPVYLSISERNALRLAIAKAEGRQP